MCFAGNTHLHVLVCLLCPLCMKVLDGNRDMNTYEFLHKDMAEEITAFLGDDEEEDLSFPEPESCDNLWAAPSVLPNLVSASA